MGSLKASLDRLNQPLVLLFLVGLLALFVGLSQAWSQAADEPKPKSLQARVDALKTKLMTADNAVAIANAKKACEVDTQCEILEAGDRHCGGPSKYIVVSTANMKVYAQVKTKIAEVTKLEKEMNKLDPPLTCTPEAPNVDGVCKEGQCQAVPRK